MYGVRLTVGYIDTFAVTATADRDLCIMILRFLIYDLFRLLLPHSIKVSAASRNLFEDEELSGRTRTRTEAMPELFVVDRDDQRELQMSGKV